MYRRIRPAPAPAAKAAFVVPVVKDGQPPRTGVAAADRAVQQSVRHAPFAADRAPAAGFGLNGCSTRWIDDPGVLLVGLGPADRLDGEAWRRAAAAAVRTAHPLRLTALHWAGPAVAQHAADIADGVSLANFEFTGFRGATLEPDPPIDLTLSVAGGKPAHAALRDALLLGECVATTRTLAATPPNVANPAYLTNFCRRLARDAGLTCTVIDAARAKRLGMGGLLAVGAAGSTPPAMIVLEWKGRGRGQGRASSPAKRGDKPVLLVGKAVTFDTGGYSLKPGGGKGMKYDKCGGAAVIGIMQAIARLKLAPRVVALIPTVENMIDAGAYRVDDIITFTNGVTCEVTNTDAEGRLILADALAYGTKKYNPRAVVDLATLTGGVTVALGPWHAGLYANNDALARQLTEAGERTGEKLWPLPLTDDVRDFMKGTHADLVNSNEKRWAHPGQGAGFLSWFVGEDAPRQMPTLPWAHLDIAGVADTDGITTLQAKGPSGFGVRLIVDWLRQLA